MKLLHTITILISLASFAVSIRAEPTKAVGITAQSAVMISNTQSILAFRLSNNLEQDVIVFPLGTLHNRLDITYPDGKKKELIVPVDHIEAVTINPSKSYIWKVNASNKVGLYSVFQEQKGLYRIVWKVKAINFDQIESNEILVINNGD